MNSLCDKYLQSSLALMAVCGKMALWSKKNKIYWVKFLDQRKMVQQSLSSDHVAKLKIRVKRLSINWSKIFTTIGPCAISVAIASYDNLCFFNVRLKGAIFSDLIIIFIWTLSKLDLLVQNVEVLQSIKSSSRAIRWRPKRIPSEMEGFRK